MSTVLWLRYPRNPLRNCINAYSELAILTALVTNCTGCLTCRLTGCLALAASALLHGVCQFLGCKSLNTLHVLHIILRSALSFGASDFDFL